MRRIVEALVPAALGLLAYAVSYSAAFTVRSLLSPNVEFDSVGALLVGSFLEGLFWTLFYGIPLALPVTLLLGFVPARHASAAALAATSLAFVSILLLDPGERLLDVLLLAASVWLGLRTSLRRLERRPEAR